MYLVANEKSQYFAVSLHSQPKQNNSEVQRAVVVYSTYILCIFTVSTFANVI